MNKCKRCECELSILEDFAERQSVAREDYTEWLADSYWTDEDVPTEDSFVAWQVERFSPNGLWVCDECADALQRIYGFNTDFWPIKEEALVQISAVIPHGEQV